MMEYYKRSLKDKKLKRLKKFKAGSWVNVINPSESEVDRLAEKFDLDKPNLESGLDKNEVPRVEFEDNETYIILNIRSPSDPKDLHTLLILIHDDFFMTLSRYKPEFFDKIINMKIGFYTTQKLKGLIRILHFINKDFEKATKKIVKSVNEKERASEELDEKDLKELLDQENLLNNLHSSYYYNNKVYEKIVKNVKFHEEDKEFLDDLMIEAEQGLDLCRSSLKTISNLRNHYVISLSNKLNKVITLLTVLTVFISIPGALSGIYGMNISLPFQDDPNAFYYILGFVALFWTGMLIFFRKMKII